jgi:phosphopentomutase
MMSLEEMNNVHFDKFVAPTQYDRAIYGATWKCNTENKPSFYIQTSKDMNSPHWESMGTFLLRSFEEFLDNQTFLNECLRLYDININSPLHNISKIIEKHDFRRAQ